MVGRDCQRQNIPLSRRGMPLQDVLSPSGARGSVHSRADAFEQIHKYQEICIDDSRNHSLTEFATINDKKKNDAAVNRFLENILKAESDLKWIDHVVDRLNHRAFLKDSPAYRNEYSTGSVNMKDVLGRADIGYGSRLRGKRGFDRNYETTWMLQKKKHEGESTRDVPERVYLDNDMTFKRDADGTDFDALYRSHGTQLDRAVHERDAMAADRTREKDPRSSGDWSNSNEKLEVTNGHGIPWRSAYKSTRDILVNSASKEGEEDSPIDTDARDRSGVESAYGPTYADTFTALREPPAVVKGEKFENTPLSLPSLKRTVLELRNSLILDDKKKNRFSEESNWWDNSRPAVFEVFDLEKHALDNHLDEDTAWRMKRARNTEHENENDLRIVQGADFEESYLEERNLQEPRDRGKRNRRSFVVESSNNRTGISENDEFHDAQIIKHALENATQSHSPGRSADSRNETLEMNSQETSVRLEVETAPKNIGHTATGHANSLDFEGDLSASNTSTVSMRFSTNDGIEDSRKSAGDRSIGEKSGVATRRISQGAGSANGGQSKGAGEESPRGNTSRSVFFSSATNESLDDAVVVETTAATKAGERIGTNGTRAENRGPILDVIMEIFETPQGRSYQKQEAARLSQRTGKDGISTEKMKTSGVDVESRNANAKAAAASPPTIDLVDGATTKPEATTTNYTFHGTDESIISNDRRLATAPVDNDSREQQMVPPLSAENANANKSNGNSDTDKIDIRARESNGNETINAKGDIRAAIETDGYRESDGNSPRKLLWISTTSTDEARQRSRTIVTNISSHEEARGREDSAEGSPASQKADPNSHILDANRHVRRKRSAYALENHEANNEMDSANVASKKEAAVNSDDEQEDDEEYLNQNVGQFMGNYNDREEDAIEGNSKVMQNEREEQALSGQEIDPMKARVDVLIKQKLDARSKDKDGDYRRKKRDTLDTIEYYDYDGDEEQEARDALERNEQGIENKDDKHSIEDKAKIKRDDKMQSYKPSELGKKKNENAEAVMKEERKKARLKNKEPKEEFVAELGESKNKTAKSGRQDDGKPSEFFESSVGNALNAEGHSSANENTKAIRQGESVVSNIYHEEPIDAKSNWLDEPLANGMESSRNSEPALKNKCNAEIASYKPSEYVSNSHTKVNPDVVDVSLDIQPDAILQSEDLGVAKDLYEDFGQRPEDRHYYREDDRKDPMDVEPLYEELKKVYDWPDGELKSGPRLRGDQRLRYESDDKLEMKPSQLQSSDDSLFSSNQNDNAERRSHFADASWTRSHGTPSNNVTLKITDDVFKDGLSKNSSTEKNPRNVLSVSTTEIKVLKILESKNGSVAEGSVAESWPVVDTDSGSPYENRKYVESAMRKVLKRNLNSEKQSAIGPQDLRESFVDYLDWHDDFDNAKVKFGRGLKALDEIPDPRNQIPGQDNDKSDARNITNSELRDSLQTYHNDSSRDSYDNVTANLIKIFNIDHDALDQSTRKFQDPMSMNMIDMSGDEDLEAAEQSINHQTPRIRRAADSYRTFYDDMSQNRRDSDEVGSLDNRLLLPNNFEDRSDRAYYRYKTPNWIDDIEYLDRYSKRPRRTDSKKKQKARMKNKKRKHSAKISAKKASSHSSSISQRNRRHRAHRSDMSRSAKRSDWKPKRKDKAEASRSAGRSSSQRSKMTDWELLRAGMNEVAGEKVLYENVEDQSTVKPKEDDARRKEITLLLAADNVDDESQMDMALHGELAGKIVDHIFEQVQKNSQLKSVLGPGLHRNYKTEDAIAASNVYRQGLNETGTNHTETMMKRIMELFDKLILSEVQRKTCITLSPDMREFLGWMLEVDREEESLEEAPPLPLVREKVTPKEEPGKKSRFLFDNASVQEGEEDIGSLQKKVRILETLVKEYNALTTEEKAQVQEVHDYLVRQLNSLLRYIEAREAAKTGAKVPTEAARSGTGSILQYQSAVPNIANASYSMTKNTFSSPTDAHNFFQFNDASLKTAHKQSLRDDHVAPRHRGTRSLDGVSPKRRRKKKRQKNEKRRKSKQKRGKPRERQNARRAGSSGYKRSRQKRANLGEGSRDSLYLGYEEPTIYDSFDILDAQLTGKRTKIKRESADGRYSGIEDDGKLDLLPIKGKNRLEDEVILLNKREAWKRQNEEQLEEVAFGKDMRKNSAKREKTRFVKLMEGDKRKSIGEMGSRTKREDVVRAASTITGAARSNDSRTTFGVDDGKEPTKNSTASDEHNDDDATGKDGLRLIERRINVFEDNKTDAAIHMTNAREVSAAEKLATNAGTDNHVEEKLRAINRETKIDNANEDTSLVLNSTRDAVPRVSKGRRKVSRAKEGADDDNAVKLNRATNYRSEEMDPGIELKNLRQQRGERIYGVAENWAANSIYNEDNLGRNRLGEDYAAELDELGDPNTDPEDNLVLPRLRSNKRPSDITEWKMMERSPRRDERASRSRFRFARENEMPASSSIEDVAIDRDAYLSDPTFWQSEHRGRRNGAYGVIPALRVIRKYDRFPRGIHPRMKRVFRMVSFEDPRGVDPKILLEAGKLPRLRSKRRWNDLAEFEVYPTMKESNREFQDILRFRDNPELDDRVIYDDRIRSRLSAWPYRYYDYNFADLPTFRFDADILGRDSDLYRHALPAGTYLEYGPFKERSRALNQGVARRNRFRSRTTTEKAVDFPADNLANRSSEFGLACGEFRVETDEPDAFANREGSLVSDETKHARKTSDGNETKLKE